MIERYSVKEIQDIWNDEHKLQTWLDVEILVTEAWSELGVIPKDDVVAIKSKSKVDINRMLEIESETKHDVVAFTRMISEFLGDEKKWIHLGLTSTDIVDTAQNKLIQESNLVLIKHMNDLINTLKNKALEFKEQIIIGRTHGMFGEPTSLGLKFLLWFEEMKRQLERLDFARKEIEVTKISGSMGNYANLELEVEEYVGKKMNLTVDKLSTQVTQRDRHASLVSVFANISSTLEKISTEIRHFQRSEVQEMSEGFGKGQKGSSSMPHKKNPISSENICGLARYVRSFVTMSLENNVLWHERDISHSSNERIMLPDLFNALVYIVNRMNSTIENLYVNTDKIQEHLLEQKGIYFSQRILTYIIMNSNFSREEVYDFVQECTLETQKNNKVFKDVLIERGVNKFIPDKNVLDDLFDDKYFIRNVDKIYRRVI